MEWAHTAQVFGSTLDSLRHSHTLARETVERGVNVHTATEFLTSLYDGDLSNDSFGGVHEGGRLCEKELLERRRSSHDETRRNEFSKKGGWRHRLVHWLTISHSPDKETETSYYELLHAPQRESPQYDPLFLDYSGVYWALSAAHRDQLIGMGIDLSRTPDLSFATSKENLNLRFMFDHPLIDRSFTGSKLRSLRAILNNLRSELQPSTLAAAWVYFEKLVGMNKVHKDNRRLIFGACVSLSCKFHEDKRSAIEVLQIVTNQFTRDTPPREIAQKEFHIFAALGFDLRVTEKDLLPQLLMFDSAAQSEPNHATVNVSHPLVFVGR